MQKKIYVVSRVCFLVIITLFCGLAALSVENAVNKSRFQDTVDRTSPLDEDIADIAKQLEAGRKLVKIKRVVGEGENPKDIVTGVFDMVENYSDEAAKISMHKRNFQHYIQGQTIKFVRINSGVTETEQESLEQEYDRMYEEICRDIRHLERASDRRKLNAILAYMAREYSYDYDYYKKQLPLLKRVAESRQIVCTGYSEIIDELCERMGIDCRIITNRTHAWNYVRLDGADHYIQIDGVDKYMPYRIYETELNFLPTNEIRLASVADNCIFWMHSCPLAAILIAGISAGYVIEEIRTYSYVHKRFKKKVHLPRK